MNLVMDNTIEEVGSSERNEIGMVVSNLPVSTPSKTKQRMNNNKDDNGHPVCGFIV